MTRRNWIRFRWIRRAAIVMAAAPLFQLSQCGTGLSQVLATAVNQAPATFYQTLNGIALAPIRALIGGQFFGANLTGGTATDTEGDADS